MRFPAAAPLINTEPSTNTAFTQAEVAQLPSAGGDITNIADTAPGVVVNGTGGYGNFTVNGLPATSNLFTVNGENDMDPYFNINNSGASNLTLGQNEIRRSDGHHQSLRRPVWTAGWCAGHLRDQVGHQPVPRQRRVLVERTLSECQRLDDNEQTSSAIADGLFSNANQWATSFGGPIIKNKTFFFVDYEGMRFMLPNSPRSRHSHSGISLTRCMSNISDPTSPNYQPNEIIYLPDRCSICWQGANGVGRRCAGCPRLLLQRPGPSEFSRLYCGDHALRRNFPRVSERIR